MVWLGMDLKDHFDSAHNFFYYIFFGRETRNYTLDLHIANQKLAK